jgi:hypothetical protein
MSSRRGYLVVLSEFEIPGYQGVYRMPPYPSPHAEEAEAIDKYVFGSFKSEAAGDLIPSVEDARKLLKMFRSSPRAFEIIYVTSDEDGPEGVESEELGYDVANCQGEWWSVIADFPGSSQFDEFCKGLNSYGLFSQRTWAERFLAKCIQERVPDCDYAALGVVKVFRVKP